MAKYLIDFPSGPLDEYRNKASFDWKKMKIFLENEDILEYKFALYKQLQKYPIFFPNSLETPTLDEQKRISALRSLTLTNIDLLDMPEMLSDLRKPSAVLDILFQLDPAMIIKKSISFNMFPSVFTSMGTDQHMKYFDKGATGEIIGAYCLTEIGHGSNAKCMRTTSTFDKSTQEFILHTPDFQAAKCWAGMLGQMATHAVVYAQLITPDGVNHSLHAFVVKIRDPKTYLPFPGITVGDMGEKIGLNGIDNGFLMFNQYRIPKSALLNKTGDVTKDGQYVTPYRDPNKRYGASLGALSMGRVNITSICSAYVAHALTIAIRYSAVRKQFGPENGDEIPILEYQSHQYRLLPYLAVAYILKIFGIYQMSLQYKFTIDSILARDKDKLSDLGLELHALSSASKPVAGWVVRDAVQECREACAGHGFLKASGIGDIKNAQDANCTYEGENHVLIQQTSNWLVKLWPLVLQGQKITSPLKSIDFLTDAQYILRSKLTVTTYENLIKPETLLSIYQWLVCFLLKITFEKVERLSKNGADPFSAKNDSQVYYCKNLATVYIQHFMLQRNLVVINEAADPALKNVLLKLFALYGIWSLEKHIPTLYQGGYVTSPNFVTLIQDSVLFLCKDLKDDSVALIDVLAPPDFMINSVLGRSDGLVYKHLEAAMVPHAEPRPKWWKEIANWRTNSQSKL